MSQIAFFTRDGDMRDERTRISRPHHARKRADGALIRATILNVVRLVLQRALVALYRFVQLVLSGKSPAQIIIRFDKTRIELNGLVIEFHGLRELTAIVENAAERVADGGRVGPNFVGAAA